MKLGLREARRKAMEFAAEFISDADWDVVWGDEIAEAAFGNEKLAETLARAKREAVERIRRQAGSATARKEPT